MDQEKDRGTTNLLDLLAGLPRKGPIRVLAGRGRGARCAICGEAILPTSPEYKVEVESESTPFVHMHLLCFHAWRTAKQGNESA